MGEGEVSRKAISPARDRMQSDLLTGAVGTLLVMKAILTGAALYRLAPLPAWFWIACMVSAGFALLVWMLRSATGPAAALGGVICCNLLLAQSHGGGWWRTDLPALLVLFLLTFAATRFGRRHKERLGIAEPRTGRRRASQVIANLGVAGLCAGAASPALFLACLAALAEATADTVSSEVGQVLGGRTLLLTTLRPVPRGTDGGISLAGTLLGASSALMVAGIAAATYPLSPLQLALIFAAGTAGLLFDSLLGATAERRGWLGNDLVNFTSTAFAAALAYAAAGLLKPR